MKKNNPHAGKSIIEIIWEELDSIMDRLMSDGEPSKSSMVGDVLTVDSTKAASDIAREWWDALRLWGEERGQAQGVAYCLAVLTNPYHVDVEAIRAEAVRRWKGRQGS
jgi:hypothetical protein